MEDLLQPQIQDSCKLALPDGLRDLMSDISREVLRTQPLDLYNFIVDYLEALLLARDTLSIAGRVCSDVYECDCQPELDEELRNLGLDGEDLDTAKNVVMEYFDKGEVKEGKLLMKLLKTTNIDEDMLPAIQEAIRTSFRKHQLALNAKIKVDAEEANKRGQTAGQNTLRFYELSKMDRENDKQKAARKIQSYFRGYLIRRNLKVKPKPTENAVKIKKTYEVTPARKAQKEKPVRPSTSKSIRNSFGRLSSTSLAGSHVRLPKYVPYSVHDFTFDESEELEMRRHNIDYTLENNFKDMKTDEGKKIAFHEHHTLHEIESFLFEEEEEIEPCVGEEIIDEEIVEDIAEEDIESNTSEELPEVEEDISDEKLAKVIVLEVVSTAIAKKNKHDIIDNSIEENTLGSEVSSSDEITEAEDEIKPLHEEIKE